VPAAAATRRVVVEFPTPLLNRAEGVLPELAINRSELIRDRGRTVFGRFPTG